MPLTEVVLDFFDRLKSVSRGYASFDYHFERFEPTSLVRLDILINQERVDALSIIVHPEIRKNLLKIKTVTEGLRGLMVWTGLQVDIAKLEKDKFKKQRAEDWVALLTPILKSFSTDLGLEAANTALQIYGGHGYIKDHGIEQLSLIHI